MQTEQFKVIDNEYFQTILPNGLTLVSGAPFNNLPRDTRSYSVSVSAGRLDDEYKPGSLLALKQRAENYCKRHLQTRHLADELEILIRDCYSTFRFKHRDTHEHNLSSFSWVLRSLITQDAFCALTDKAPVNPDIKIADEMDRFWSWFYAKACPDWHRLQLSIKDVTLMSQVIDEKDILNFRDKFLHLNNLLVFNSYPDLHEELIWNLGDLPNMEKPAHRPNPDKAPLCLVNEVYPFGPERKRAEHILLYFPLPTDQRAFFIAKLVLEAIYALKDGIFSERANKLSVQPWRIDVYATMWPQPLGFIRLTVCKKQIEDFADLVCNAPIYFQALSIRELNHYVNEATDSMIKKYDITPSSLIRDFWLMGQPLDKLESLGHFTHEDMRMVARVYLRQDRLGRISNLPGLPQGTTLLSYFKVS